MDKTPLERAIEACGGSAKLAQRLGITAQAVSQWRSVPPGRALQVANITGVPVEELLKQSEPATQ
jgi:DNA-binding transcriptional regulator YdaS (Cro superfamily)